MAVSLQQIAQSGNKIRSGTLEIVPRFLMSRYYIDILNGQQRFPPQVDRPLLSTQ